MQAAMITWLAQVSSVCLSLAGRAGFIFLRLLDLRLLKRVYEKQPTHVSRDLTVLQYQADDSEDLG